MPENNENKVAQILGGVAGVMRAEFNKTANIEHKSEKGRAREVVAVRDFFEQYLPGTVRIVHGGEIITPAGKVSPQCDIIIHDPSAPPMLDAQSYHIIPNE